VKIWLRVGNTGRAFSAACSLAFPVIWLINVQGLDSLFGTHRGRTRVLRKHGFAMKTVLSFFNNTSIEAGCFFKN